jgi:cobalt/nickel transport system permease protein
VAGSHIHALYLHGHSVVHRFAPQVKIATAFGVVVGIVITPREAVLAFILYAITLSVVGAVAGIGPRFAAKRLLVEVPFLFVALLLPILGGGETVTVVGINLSVAGLWDAWNLIAKATLGLGVAIILGATTQVPDLLAGFDGLKMPSVVTAIAGFMVRYVDVILSDWSRMRVAMASRGHDPRWFTQIGPYGRTLGTMFIRTYERGERVYLSMSSRGYMGTMPEALQPATPAREWLMGGGLVVAVWLVAATGWVAT